VDLSCLVIDTANRSDFSWPIRLRYEDSSMEVCRTGIVFPNGFLGLHVVEIVFGPQIAILGVRQIQSLISHEFAHHKLRHIKPLAFRACNVLCRIRNPKVRNFMLKRLVNLVPKQKQDEFAADAYASRSCSAQDLAIALLLLDISWEAMSTIKQTGNCFGFPVQLQTDSVEVGGNFRYKLMYETIKQIFASRPDIVQRASSVALHNQQDSDEHPCVQARIEHLGFDWNSICDLAHASIKNSLNDPITFDI